MTCAAAQLERLLCKSPTPRVACAPVTCAPQPHVRPSRFSATRAPITQSCCCQASVLIPGALTTAPSRCVHSRLARTHGMQLNTRAAPAAACAAGCDRPPARLRCGLPVVTGASLVRLFTPTQEGETRTKRMHGAGALCCTTRARALRRGCCRTTPARRQSRCCCSCGCSRPPRLSPH